MNKSYDETINYESDSPLLRWNSYSVNESMCDVFRYFASYNFNRISSTCLQDSVN